MALNVSCMALNVFYIALNVSCIALNVSCIALNVSCVALNVFSIPLNVFGLQQKFNITLPVRYGLSANETQRKSLKSTTEKRCLPKSF
jgi:hypothetical protein